MCVCVCVSKPAHICPSLPVRAPTPSLSPTATRKLLAEKRNLNKLARKPDPFEVPGPVVQNRCRLSNASRRPRRSTYETLPNWQPARLAHCHAGGVGWVGCFDKITQQSLPVPDITSATRLSAEMRRGGVVLGFFGPLESRLHTKHMLQVSRQMMRIWSILSEAFQAKGFVFLKREICFKSFFCGEE